MKTQRMILGQEALTNNDAREALRDYALGAGDREVILELYQAGKLNDCVVRLDIPLYRGILLTKKRVNENELKGKGYGSFSSDRGVAWQFAKELVEDDVANILMEVRPNDTKVVIDMQKAFAKYGITDEGCLFSMKYESEYFVIYNKVKITYL